MSILSLMLVLQQLKLLPTSGGKIDFAFIDLCGMVSPAVCSALHQLQDSFAPKARIALTSLMEIRQRLSIRAFMKAFGELDSRALQILSASGSTQWVSGILNSHWDVAYGGRIHFSADEKRIAQGQNNVINFVWQWQAATAALDGWEISVSDAIRYGDGLTMGLVVFQLVKTKPQGEFAAIQAICRPKGTTTKPGFSSAKQAWITRYERMLTGGAGYLDRPSRQETEKKLKQLLYERDGGKENSQNKFSQRAKKAWATRRKNALA